MVNQEYPKWIQAVFSELSAIGVSLAPVFFSTYTQHWFLLQEFNIPGGLSRRGINIELSEFINEIYETILNCTQLCCWNLSSFYHWTQVLSSSLVLPSLFDQRTSCSRHYRCLHWALLPRKVSFPRGQQESCVTGHSFNYTEPPVIQWGS